MRRLCLVGILPLLVLSGIEVSAQESLEDRITLLKSLPRENGLISMSKDLFHVLVLSPNRNYSFVFMIGTKVAECGPCVPTMEALINVANRWNSQHPDSSEISFGFIDFATSIEIVQLLQISTAPYIIYIGPHQDLHTLEKTNHPHIVGVAPNLAAWISKMSGLRVEATVKMDYSKVYPLASAIIFIAILWKLKFFHSARFVGAVSLIFICGMCSGYMWVSINSMPFMSVQNGKVVYVYPESRAQFGSECLLIMLFYSMTSGGVVFLTNKCPKLRGRRFLYTIGVVFGVGIAVIGFNQMAETYSTKTGFLPYHFSLL